MWGDCIESVNSLIEDLVRPSNEMQRVIGAVAGGDLSKKVTADVQGEMLELKNTINDMVDQLNGTPPPPFFLKKKKTSSPRSPASHARSAPRASSARRRP